MASTGGLCRCIRREIVECQALRIGENRLRLTFDCGRCRLNHGGRTAAGRCSCRGCSCTTRRATGSCGATTSCDKHYYQETTSEQEKAFKKHGMFTFLENSVCYILKMIYLIETYEQRLHARDLRR